MSFSTEIKKKNYNHSGVVLSTADADFVLYLKKTNQVDTVYADQSIYCTQTI